MAGTKRCATTLVAAMLLQLLLGFDSIAPSTQSRYLRTLRAPLGANSGFLGWPQQDSSAPPSPNRVRNLLASGEAKTRSGELQAGDMAGGGDDEEEAAIEALVGYLLEQLRHRRVEIGQYYPPASTLLQGRVYNGGSGNPDAELGNLGNFKYPGPFQKRRYLDVMSGPEPQHRRSAPSVASSSSGGGSS